MVNVYWVKAEKKTVLYEEKKIICMVGIGPHVYFLIQKQ